MRLGKKYIPCLRWKQGEYQALTKLSPETKKCIIPVFDIAEYFMNGPGKSFDHEDGKNAKSIDDHLSKVPKRIKEKWGVDECFIDLRHVDIESRLVDGSHPVSFMFGGLRSFGVEAIPVIGTERDPAYRSAIIDVVNIDKRGICLRSTLETVTSVSYDTDIKKMLADFGIGPKDCDFLLDLGAPDNFEPLDVFAQILTNTIAQLPYLNEWRSFGIIGFSLPASINKLSLDVSILPRNEWLLYEKLVSSLRATGIRIPVYGDYAVNHPAAVNLDMRFIYPKASVKYSIKNNWLVSVGQPIRGKKGVGLGQYRKLCDQVVKSDQFCGPLFSFGDEYIAKCASGQVNPGNQSRFREVGTSHHFEMVVNNDLANLGVS